MSVQDFMRRIITPLKIGQSNHTPEFATAAGTDVAHDLTLVTAKVMAAINWRFLGDDEMERQVKRDFELDVDFQEGGPAGETMEGRDCCLLITLRNMLIL